MPLTDQQLDARLRNVPLPTQLLARLTSVCTAGEVAQAAANEDGEAGLDAALNAVAPPAGLFASLKRMAAADELDWVQTADTLRAVEPPAGMQRRLLRIPRPARGQFGWRSWSAAASIFVAACSAYLCAVLIFLMSSVRDRASEPEFFVLERPLVSPPEWGLPETEMMTPQRFARDDDTPSSEAMEAQPTTDSAASDAVAFADPQAAPPAPVGLPDPIAAFDAFQNQVVRYFIAYPWESPLHDLPDVVASPVGEGPDPEIVPWLPTGLSPGLDPPPYRGFDGAFFYHYDEWPVVLLDKNTDPRLHACRVPLRVGSDSFELTRRYLFDERPRRPPPEEIRKEDFLAAVEYSLPASQQEGMSIHMTGGPSPFSGPGMYLVQVVLQAPHLAPPRPRATHLVVAVNVSQSMKLGDRLGVVRRALATLPRELTADDRVSLVLFNDSVETSSDSYSKDDEALWCASLARMSPQGGTNLVAALRAAYLLLGPPDFNPDDVDRRIVLVTDGLSPLDDYTLDRLQAAAQAAADGGVTLDVADVSPTSRQENGQLEQLAVAGGGRLKRLGNRFEVRGFVLEALRGASHVAATDVELSVTFNPAMVAAYRQIGHEPSRAKFLQLSSDAPEQGTTFWSGQQATALFEIELRPNVPGGGADMSLLRDAVATAYLTWTAPDGELRRQLEQMSHLQLARTYKESAPSLQMAALVAEAAEILADSNFAPRTTLEDVLAAAETAGSSVRNEPSFVDFLAVIREASRRAKVQRR